MVMKVYSPEFKADAVALYLSDPSHTFEGIGKDLGISRETYRRRNTIERCFNRLKGVRGIATRYEKTATSYEAAVTLASFRRWARSV
jgi:transposase